MSKAGRQRADVALVTCGLAESRARAQALIRAGHAYRDDIRIEKPGQMVVCEDLVLVPSQLLNRRRRRPRAPLPQLTRLLPVPKQSLLRLSQ